MHVDNEALLARKSNLDAGGVLSLYDALNIEHNAARQTLTLFRVGGRGQQETLFALPSTEEREAR